MSGTGQVKEEFDGLFSGGTALVDGLNDNIKATILDLTSSNPLTVAIVDGNGDQITSFGGGTQYTEGDTDASITGTAALWEDGSDTLRAISMAKPLPVQPGTSISFPVTDNGGSLTVDNGGTFAVQVSSALPAGANAIGKLAANSGVDIGDVDVTSIAAGDNTIGRFKLTDGTDVADILDLSNSNPLAVAIVDSNGDQIASFGGGTQYTEDAAAAANPVGTALNLIRADSLAGLTSTDGDNVAARGTDKGELYVKHVDNITVNSHAVTNAGTFAVQAAQSGTWNIGTLTTITNVVHVDDNSSSLTVDNGGTFAVQATIAAAANNIAKAEDAASANADVGVPAMAIQLATPADTAGTDGDYAMLQMSAGRLWVSSKIDTALPAGTNGIGKLTSNTGVTIGAVEIAASQTLATLTSITNVVHVDDNSSSITVDNGGTFAVQATVAASATNIAKAEDAASADADVGVPAMAVRKATPANTSGTDGDYEMLQISAGRIWASAVLEAGSAAIGKLAANNGVIIGDVNVVSNIPGTGATNLGKAEDAAHSSGDTGVFMLAIRDDTLNATSGTEGDYEALHTNEDGALWTEDTVSTKGGWSVGNFTSGDTYTALTNSAQVIKGSAGKFGGYYIYNPNATAQYVMIYNTAAASVTVGTTTAILIFTIPATSAANLEISKGIPFGTAMSIAAATTAGGNGAPTTALEAMVWYK